MKPANYQIDNKDGRGNIDTSAQTCWRWNSVIGLEVGACPAHWDISSPAILSTTDYRNSPHHTWRLTISRARSANSPPHALPQSRINHMWPTAILFSFPMN